MGIHVHVYACVCACFDCCLCACVGGAKNNIIKNTKIVGDDFRSLMDKPPITKTTRAASYCKIKV